MKEKKSSQFRQEEIESFIQEYKKKLDQINYLLSFPSYKSLADFPISENIQKIICKLEGLKRTGLYQHNTFLESGIVSSRLYNYFDEGLKKFDTLYASAQKNKCPYSPHDFVEGAGYPLVGSVAAIVLIGIFGGLALMPIGWIAIPIVILIGTIVGMIYMGVVNNKELKNPNSAYKVELKDSINAFNEHVNNLELLTRNDIETIEKVVKANVNLDKISKPGRPDPAYHSVNFQKQDSNNRSNTPPPAEVRLDK